MKKLQIIFIFLLLSMIGSGLSNVAGATTTTTPGQTVYAASRINPTGLESDEVMIDPSLTGPTSVCLSSTGNVYTTDAGQTNYVWVVSGGTITAGGTANNHTATVTWTAAGAKTISVTYTGATTTVLPVTVNPLTSGVAIAASATSVFTGTTVTFTATPTNGGTSPFYQWKVNGIDAGTNNPVFAYVPLHGDAVYCVMTPNAPCVSASFASGVITISVSSKPLIVTIPTITATPGSTVIFPVKLTGASASGTPISSAGIQISYDPAVLDYDTLINFYPGMPGPQWFFSGNLNTVAANWLEPSGLTLAVPDNTTLFEIRFTYIGGTCTLPYTMFDFTDVLYNLINTNHVDGGISPTVSLPAGYVAGDFHQHTTYTDGSYSFAHVMQKNNEFDLDWWANSEHGGGFNRDATFSGIDLGGTTLYWDSYVPNPIIGTMSTSGGHQNMWRWQSLRDYSFQNTRMFRALYTTKMIFQSYEMNVPGHEHASMGLINNQFDPSPNCNPIAEFEFKFDGSDADLTGGVAQGWTKSVLSGHAKAVEAIAWLQTNYPNTSYVVAAHPERKNLNNIAGFRDMNTAGPDVCFGFESMPGHQRGPDRGEYKASNGTVGTFTLGGCGIYAGKVGGLWDAMLSEGRGWWLFSSSDFHALGADFYPGEYQKTYTYVANRSNPQSYIDGLRSGNSFIVNGDLIDSLEFKVGEAPAMLLYATMGETFETTQESVVVKIKVRDPQGNNHNTYSAYTNPALDHIDLIKGKVTGLIAPSSPNYSIDTTPNTMVIARFDAIGGVVSPNGVVSQAWTDLGNGLKEITYTYNNLVDSVYFRLRGTNLGLNVTSETDANGNPLSDGLMSPNSPAKAFADLWFYSNPIFVSGPVSPSLSGPATACQGSTGNVYTTEAAQTNYTWTVSGGTITAGGGITNNTVTVTWPSAGNHSVAVAYSGSVTTTLPVTVYTPVNVTAVAGTIACAGGTTTVTVSATGGTPPYTGTGDFTMGAGTHILTVSDVNGCSGFATVTITEPPFFTLKSTMASANGAEISAFDASSGRIYTVAGPALEYYTLNNAGVLSGPNNVPFGFTPPGGTTVIPNSVAVKNGIAAVSYAVVGANNAQQQGIVAFYTASTAAYISNVTVGYLPDMIAFTPDGTKLLTANEGEPNSYGQPTSFDPEGSVSIIDISGGVASITVTDAGFTSFNGQLAALKTAGVRIYGPGATVAMDLEPEYLTFSPDGTTAFVTLQENNAIAKLDIATATITDIYPLGLKDHSIAGNSLDASDRDVNGTAGGGGKINMQNWPVKGMYEPDGIATFTMGANTYYVTANEGDARDYTGFTEEVRISSGSYVLDPAVFANAATLKLSQNLGRLNASNATGNTDGDAEFEEIHAFGARSFTIWNSSFSKVFDSQDQLEKTTSVRNAAGFNSDGTAATFDSRSDNKGPEPEGIAIGTVNGVQYAFVGSERTGDIFVYDLTNPLAPVLKQYINTPADLGVEGIQFVSAGQSPTGKALLITSAEVSKTVTVYEFSAAPVITLLGNTTVQVCQNTTYTDAGATAVDYPGNDITGSIVPTSTVNTAVPGTYSVTYNVTDACGIAALPVTRTVIVNPSAAVSVSIVASANPVCAGTSVTFTATPVNGGTTPVYQWKRNGSNVGTNNPVYTVAPANNDAITCILTSNAPCATGSPATSNAIIMTVNPTTASISIAASANPVLSGTSVTFTATATNGGPTPTYLWKVNGSDAGSNSPTYTYTPVNGDIVFCYLTSSAPCVPPTAVFLSNLITMTVNFPVGSLLVTLPNKTAMPGDILYYPVKLKGASSSGTPISAADIQVTYDPMVFHYDTLVNFYTSMPKNQWFFSGALNTVAANWLEPGGGTLSIPDSTTLFEIKFTYLGGDGTLPFIVNDFTDVNFNLIPTNHINGGVTQLVPVSSTVQNVTVAAGHDTCFNATQVITVAGNGTTFEVQDLGSATFVAGQKISFLPGTTVISGGYLHGFITENGQYCGQLPNPVVIAQVPDSKTTTSVPETMSNQSILVYPNPTNGMFTVEVKGDSQAIMTKAVIYTMSGLKVHTEILNNERKHEFSMPELAPGMYFIHVFTNQRSEILKIVKL